MDRILFQQRFEQASARAREFARRFVEEALPDELCLRVQLNASYDGNPLRGDEVVYPGDAGTERARGLVRCRVDQAVEALWRDGKVPEWINLSVIGVRPEATVLEALCCGRYTAQEELLYHKPGGLPPFHILGPALPVGYEESSRFSLYESSECDSLADVERLHPHAAKVRMLTLSGAAATDAGLGCLPVLGRLEVLELHEGRLSEHGLEPLVRQRRLVTLRAETDAEVGFPARLPALPALASLAITAPSELQVDLLALLGECRALASLSLTAGSALRASGACPSSLRTLHLVAWALSGDLRLPPALESLGLNLTQPPSVAELERLLAPTRGLRSLSLRGTTLGDEVLPLLESRGDLTYLDLVDTEMSEGAIDTLRAVRPDRRIWPSK